MKTELAFGNIRFKPADTIVLLLACLFTLRLYFNLWSSNGEAGQAETLIVYIAEQAPQEFSLKEDKINLFYIGRRNEIKYRQQSIRTELGTECIFPNIQLK